ncbi:MAG: hypothetical protein JNM36_13005 [Chitinophagales bacterium]|nr:hypothetical protein [Chitinophagales bacterium]
MGGLGQHTAFGGCDYNTFTLRRYNKDPLHLTFPDISPYSVFNNNPIVYLDHEGLAPWKAFTVFNLWAIAGKYKERLRKQNPSKRKDIDENFSRNVVGRAIESAALEALELPPNSQRIYNKDKTEWVVPDAIIPAVAYDGFKTVPFEDITEVFTGEDFVEIKTPTSTTNRLLMYSGRVKKQVDYYLDHLSNTHRRNETIIGSLSIVVPAGTTIDSRIVAEATKRNIPLFVSELQYDTENSNSIRLSTAKWVDRNDINIGGQFLSSIPLIKWLLTRSWNGKNKTLGGSKAVNVEKHFEKATNDQQKIYNKPPKR